jgi:hypothetical protein
MAWICPDGSRITEEELSYGYVPNYQNYTNAANAYQQGLSQFAQLQQAQMNHIPYGGYLAPNIVAQEPTGTKYEKRSAEETWLRRRVSEICWTPS